MRSQKEYDKQNVARVSGRENREERAEKEIGKSNEIAKKYWLMRIYQIRIVYLFLAYLEKICQKNAFLAKLRPKN